METAVASDSKDRTALSLSMDQLASSSPFPSPSSSFVPPPVPGAHEFAVPSPLTGRGKKFSNAKKEPDEATITAANSIAPFENKPNGEESTPSSIPAPLIDPPPENSSIPTVLPPIAASPVTPTPSSGFSQTQPQESPEDTATTAPTIIATSVIPTTPTSPSHHLPRDPLTPTSQRPRDSLISNRPAPPSPEISHRISGAPSTSSNRSRSGRSSRPPSTALSRTNSTRMNARQSLQLALANSQASASARRIRQLTIKIRDFAFPSHDERHEGRGPDVPRPNRVRTLNRHLTGGSVSSVASSEGDDDGAEEDDGWSGFKWGFGPFTWVPERTSGGGGGEADGYVPSNTDFARNFGPEAGGNQSEGADADVDADGDGDEEYEELEEEEEDGDRFLLDEPLYPGMYRAIYPFVPEGASEMALEEDQIVRVVGRGGGVGWAVVVRGEGEDGGHALVPESYLEVVQIDGEAEGDGEGEASSTPASAS